jgi:hypothetical protein
MPRQGLDSDSGGSGLASWRGWLLLGSVYRICKTLSSMMAHLNRRIDLRRKVATITGCRSDRDHRS